jgi:hypothetical protein
MTTVLNPESQIVPILDYHGFWERFDKGEISGERVVPLAVFGRHVESKKIQGGAYNVPGMRIASEIAVRLNSIRGIEVKIRKTDIGFQVGYIEKPTYRGGSE